MFGPIDVSVNNAMTITFAPIAVQKYPPGVHRFVANRRAGSIIFGGHREFDRRVKEFRWQ